MQDDAYEFYDPFVTVGLIQIQLQLDHIKYTPISVNEGRENVAEIEAELKHPLFMFFDETNVEHEINKWRIVMIRELLQSLRIIPIFLGTNPQYCI